MRLQMYNAVTAHSRMAAGTTLAAHQRRQCVCGSHLGWFMDIGDAVCTTEWASTTGCGMLGPAIRRRGLGRAKGIEETLGLGWLGLGRHFVSRVVTVARVLLWHVLHTSCFQEMLDRPKRRDLFLWKPERSE